MSTTKPLHDDYELEDKLGYNFLCDATVNLIKNVSNNAHACYTVGIYGSWGAGKTSMLRQIENQLISEEDITTIWFNPWQYEKDENIVAVLFNHISQHLQFLIQAQKDITSNENNTRFKNLLVFAEKFKEASVALGSGIDAKISIPGFFSGGIDGNKVLKAYLEGKEKEADKNSSIYYGMTQHLNNAVEELNQRFVVFVDDLDRCTPETSIALLDGFKVLLDLPNFIFVLGVNDKIVEQAAKNKYMEMGIKLEDFDENYLEKIIQAPIRLPPPDREKMKSHFLGYLLSENKNKEEYYDLILEMVGANPRKLKQFLTLVSFTSDLIQDSSSLELVIKSSLLSFRVPEIFRVFEKNSLALAKINNKISESIQDTNLQSPLDVLKGTVNELDDNLNNSNAVTIYKILYTDIENGFDTEQKASVYVRVTSTGAATILKKNKKPLSQNQPENSFVHFNNNLIQIFPKEFKLGKERNDSTIVKEITSFKISKHTITQELYESITGSNPSNTIGSDLPVVFVSWFDAVRFCNELSKKLGLLPVYEFDTSGKLTSCNFDCSGFRLPTEAEWEYAADAQSFSENSIDEIAWYMSNSHMELHPVGTKMANTYGLYDMIGNVWEWCHDWFSGYDSHFPTNPSGSESGDFKVKRGGSWANFENNLSPTYRDRESPDCTNDNLGFRVVRRSELNS